MSPTSMSTESRHVNRSVDAVAMSRVLLVVYFLRKIYNQFSVFQVQAKVLAIPATVGEHGGTL